MEQTAPKVENMTIGQALSKIKIAPEKMKALLDQFDKLDRSMYVLATYLQADEQHNKQ